MRTAVIILLWSVLLLAACGNGKSSGPSCGQGTVLVDGKAVRSCVTPTSTVVGKSIRTLDGLATG